MVLTKETLKARLRYFLYPFDKRYEDLGKGSFVGNVMKDMNLPIKLQTIVTQRFEIVTPLFK